MRKSKLKKYLLTFVLFLFVMVPFTVEAKNHTFSLSAFDYDPFEDTGTGDEIIPGTDYIEPGQVIGINVEYEVGDVPVTGMQIGINYDPTVFELLTDSGEVYLEFDNSTTSQGGIWPPKGTTATLKKQTNWSADASDIVHQTDANLRQVRILISDSAQKDPLEEDGIVSTIYFRVKDAAEAGAILNIDIDSDYTRAANGATKQPVTVNGIELTVFGTKSDDVTLSSLVLTGSNGKNYITNPLFVSGTSIREFNVIVPYKVTTLNFSATATDSLAKVLLGGLGDKTLSVGDNSFTLVVQSQHGTQELYTINVKRLSNDATLKSLSLSGITLDNALSSGVYTYTATTPYKTTSTTVTATANDSNANKVTGTGAFSLSSYGDTVNTKTVTVEAEDCKSQYSDVEDNSCTKQDYEIKVTRIAPSTDNLLTDIKVDGVSVQGFTSNANTYTLPDQSNSKSSVNITATLSDNLATLSGIGTKTLNVGDNSFDIVVTAEDGTKNTYTLNIRRLNNNANLSSLTLTPTNGSGSLSPNFSGNFYNYYTYTYDSTVTSIDISAITEVNTATITSGVGTYSSGDTSANVVVTAEDGSISTYVIKFSRNKSSDNTLSSLSVDGYNLDQTFSPNTTLYTVTVPGTVDSINVNAVVNDANASIVSGTGSHNLNYGTNPIQVRVKAENGVTKDYTITVTRSKKTISSLSDLTVDGTTVSGFSENVLSYDIGTVPFNKTSISVGAITKDSDATVSGTGTRNLNTGSNTITVTVTAHDETTTTTYTIKVEREKSSDTKLKSLSMDEASISFDPDTKTYNVDVAYEVTSATITAVANYKDATATVTGPTVMSVGNNTYTITVTAEDGSIDTYQINVNRKKSTNNNLTSLKVLNSGTDYLNNFAKDKTTYDVSVPNEVTSVNVVATLEDSLNATVSGDGSKSLETGLNVYAVEVEASSGDKKSYTLNITRELNANNKLKSLEVAGHSLSPSFDPSVISYNVTVDSDVDNVAITAAADNSLSVVKGVGVKSLSTGTNTFNIDVKAENGDVKTYVVVVTRKASNDSTLQSLSIDETILDQPFSPTTKNYTASVANSVKSVTVNAVANDIKAKGVTGTGNVNLATGDNTIDVVVTAEDNTKTTYTIVVNRAKSMNANLKSIGLNGGYSITPTFDKDTTSYSVNVSNATEKILVSAEKEDETASVAGTGNISLSTGHNKIDIVVTAEDNAITKTYTIDVYRALSTNANLKSLTSSDGTITPTFDKDTTEYTLTVPYEVEDANINAVAENNAANIQISGNTGLAVGNNTATILVTAENGNIKTYEIVITRQPSSNNYLSSLEITDNKGTSYGDDPFNKLKMTYNITVDNDIDKITISAQAEDSATTVKGTGTKDLKVGSNSFTIESISANGTPRNYIINVERSKNSNTKLSSLSIDDQVLVPDFDPDVFSYSLNINDSNIDKVKINAEAEASTSKVSGTGEKELSTGLNTFSVEVEAENGDKKAYVISINRAASDNNYLSSLLTDQPMNETFSKEKLVYTVDVANSIDEINIQAVTEADISTVTGTGTHSLKVGENVFEIVVTAENNTTRTYKVKVNREASSNNNLSDLKINGNTISGFDSEKLEYFITVENDVTEADIEATLEDETATVTGTGKIDLVTTSKNSINVTVTAEDGGIKIYKIDITRKKSSNNNLVLLSALEGTLSPAFDKDTTSYTMQVPYENTQLSLTSVAEDANATIDVEGNVDFQIGNGNNVYVTVTAEDESTKTYSIQVTRLPQANNFLSSLIVASKNGKIYDLNPVFNKSTLNYSISINEDDSNLVVSGTKEAASSTVVGLENITVSSFPYVHKVVVTSAGGIDREYSITINKVKSSNASLKGITVSQGSLSPSFDPDILDYTVNVDNEVTSIDIGATLNKGQTISGTGSHSLSLGDNNIPLVVTAEDGTINTYNIKVIRNNEVDPTLSNITTDKGNISPTFSSNTVNYVLYLDSEETDVTVTPTKSLSSLKMSIALNGDDYKDVSSIKVEDLSKGNVVKVKVEGDTKVKVYTISILRSSNEKITSDTYGHDISDEMIKTVSVNTSADEIKDQLDNDNSMLKIYEKNGTTEYKGSNLGTGMIVKLIKDDVVLDQKIIVVKGDTDGNGIINAIDSLKVVNHILESDQLTGCYLEAADTTNDNDINAIDALKIVNHIIGNISLF